MPPKDEPGAFTGMVLVPASSSFLQGKQISSTAPKAYLWE